MYELFGTSKATNEVEYLGVFHKQDMALRAFDDFWGLGYCNMKLCKWTVR